LTSVSTWQLTKLSQEEASEENEVGLYARICTYMCVCMRAFMCVHKVHPCVYAKGRGENDVGVVCAHVCAYVCMYILFMYVCGRLRIECDRLVYCVNACLCA
jgi:hypothetical protein